MKKSDDIDYYEGNFHITTLSAGVFVGNGGFIRSTHRRQKELEEKNKISLPSVHIEGDVIGSLVGSQSFESALIRPATQKTNNISPANPPKRSWLEITAWVVGIIAALFAVWEFVLKRFFNQP
ncbi:MAG: hypothetical protein ACXWCG_07635 [Flavitalea sp.]